MQHKVPVIAINGVIDKQVSPLDRGFTYGDGVFETCRIIKRAIPLWNFHIERLMTSCKKLLIPITADQIEHDLAQLFAQISAEDLADAVVKIIVTRGQGGRGYRLPDVITPTVCIAIFPPSVFPSEYSTEGTSVRVCKLRLGCNTSLAGLKHLNRLEHILARAEWDDEKFAEGLLFDINNNLIEATVSNVFIVNDGNLFTPDVSEAGVAGVMRRLIIDDLALNLGITVKIQKISRHDLLSADEIFLSNSIFGIWPVIHVFDHTNHSFKRGKITVALQHALQSKIFVSA